LVYFAQLYSFLNRNKNNLIKFILNNKEINTDLPSGITLLDFIRYHQHLMGTKIGCREGDCGACTILIGELNDEKMSYRSATSCLTPLGNANEKHIVTIEGINMNSELNPIQQAMYDESATQCGFCTPGFVMSLAGFCLSDKKATTENAIAAVDGNICRCTGYKSIERAATKIATIMQKRRNDDFIQFVTEQNILPNYFGTIKSRLKNIQNIQLSIDNYQLSTQFVGGGTDLYVQKHDEMVDADSKYMLNKKELKEITKEENKCIIGSACTVTDLSESKIMQNYFPDLNKYIKLISSTPIRNIATIAGNFVNASPIGDLTIFFLALNTQLVLTDGKNKREVLLRNFYKGYKKLDKKPEEYIEKICFELPDKNTKFHFEKVSKRTHLDIASVNTAISITIQNDVILNANLSAGGVGPIPQFLEKTSQFLKGKKISEELIIEAIEIVQTEITAISDARGSEAYKRLLLSQLIKAHFITLFPTLEIEKIL